MPKRPSSARRNVQSAGFKRHHKLPVNGRSRRQEALISVPENERQFDQSLLASAAIWFSADFANRHAWSSHFCTSPAARSLASWQTDDV